MRPLRAEGDDGRWISIVIPFFVWQMKKERGNYFLLSPAINRSFGNNAPSPPGRVVDDLVVVAKAGETNIPPKHRHTKKNSVRAHPKVLLIERSETANVPFTYLVPGRGRTSDLPPYYPTWGW